MKNVISRMFKAAVISMIAAPLFVSGVASAASTYTISIPVTKVIYAPKGSKTELAQKNVEAKYKGMICDVKAVALNQGSVHPNNDIIVASGTTSVTAKDVERAAGVSTTAQGTLTLGDKVVVSLLMGKDAVFSAGMNIDLTCNEPKIEVCRDGKVITIATSEKKSTDTPAPCPIPEVSVCRDGKVITIKVTDKKSTDTNAPCPTPEVEVCRDGKVMKIKSTDKKSTDTSAPCPVAETKVCRDGINKTIKVTDKKSTDTAAPCPVKVVELPKTGAGSIVAILGATFIASVVFMQVRIRRTTK